MPLCGAPDDQSVAGLEVVRSILNCIVSTGHQHRSPFPSEVCSVPSGHGIKVEVVTCPLPIPRRCMTTSLLMLVWRSLKRIAPLKLKLEVSTRTSSIFFQGPCEPYVGRQVYEVHQGRPHQSPEKVDLEDASTPIPKRTLISLRNIFATPVLVVAVPSGTPREEDRWFGYHQNIGKLSDQYA